MRHRYSIWDSMRRMQDYFDSVFMDEMRDDDIHNRHFLERSINKDSKELGYYSKPLTDFMELENEFLLRLDMPGCDKKDIKINAKQHGVDISVERKEDKKEEDKEKGFYKYERRHAGYKRYFSLPDNADTHKLDASYKRGVLELHVPKKKHGFDDTKIIDVK